MIKNGFIFRIFVIIMTVLTTAIVPLTYADSSMNDEYLYCNYMRTDNGGYRSENKRREFHPDFIRIDVNDFVKSSAKSYSGGKVLISKTDKATYEYKRKTFIELIVVSKYEKKGPNKNGASQPQIYNCITDLDALANSIRMGTNKKLGKKWLKSSSYQASLEEFYELYKPKEVTETKIASNSSSSSNKRDDTSDLDKLISELFPSEESELGESQTVKQDNSPTTYSLELEQAGIDTNYSSVEKETPNQCLVLKNKIDGHIDKAEYDLASSAVELMKTLNCDSTKSEEKNVVRTIEEPPQPKYTSSELSCNIGPIGKTIFGTYGEYSAKSYDDNPPRNCRNTYDYCKSRARSIAEGANITPSERSTSKTYSGNCYSYGSSTDCTIRENNNSGGFAGGLADGLAKGINVAAQKKRIYVSNFEVCMADMGYRLTER